MTYVKFPAHGPPDLLHRRNLNLVQERQGMDKLICPLTGGNIKFKWFMLRIEAAFPKMPAIYFLLYSAKINSHEYFFLLFAVVPHEARHDCNGTINTYLVLTLFTTDAKFLNNLCGAICWLISLANILKKTVQTVTYLQMHIYFTLYLKLFIMYCISLMSKK